MCWGIHDLLWWESWALMMLSGLGFFCFTFTCLLPSVISGFSWSHCLWQWLDPPASLCVSTDGDQLSLSETWVQRAVAQGQLWVKTAGHGIPKWMSIAKWITNHNSFYNLYFPIMYIITAHIQQSRGCLFLSSPLVGQIMWFTLKEALKAIWWWAKVFQSPYRSHVTVCHQ